MDMEQPVGKISPIFLKTLSFSSEFFRDELFKRSNHLFFPILDFL